MLRHHDLHTDLLLAWVRTLLVFAEEWLVVLISLVSSSQVLRTSYYFSTNRVWLILFLVSSEETVFKFTSWLFWFKDRICMLCLPRIFCGEMVHALIEHRVDCELRFWSIIIPGALIMADFSISPSSLLHFRATTVGLSKVTIHQPRDRALRFLPLIDLCFFFFSSVLSRQEIFLQNWFSVLLGRLRRRWHIFPLEQHRFSPVCTRIIRTCFEPGFLVSTILPSEHYLFYFNITEE